MSASGPVRFPSEAYETIVSTARRYGVPLPDPLPRINELFFDPTPLGDAADLWHDRVTNELDSVAGKVRFAAQDTGAKWGGNAQRAFLDWTMTFTDAIRKPTENGGEIHRLVSALKGLESAFHEFQLKAVDALVNLATTLIDLAGEAGADASAGADAGSTANAAVAAEPAAGFDVAGVRHIVDALESATGPVGTLLSGLGEVMLNAETVIRTCTAGFDEIGWEVAHIAQQISGDDGVPGVVKSPHEWAPD
jgi:hypothetical protein